MTRIGISKETLLALAHKAKNHAYAPYSKFQVGAALLAENGEVYLGCNIENASYGATNCAERTAFFRAVSEGITSFQAIAIVGNAGTPCAPCGICRQVMREFCNPKTFLIYLEDGNGGVLEYTLEQLLPMSFGPESLGEEKEPLR